MTSNDDDFDDNVEHGGNDNNDVHSDNHSGYANGHIFILSHLDYSYHNNDDGIRSVTA